MILILLPVFCWYLEGLGTPSCEVGRLTQTTRVVQTSSCKDDIENAHPWTWKTGLQKPTLGPHAFRFMLYIYIWLHIYIHVYIYICVCVTSWNLSLMVFDSPNISSPEGDKKGGIMCGKWTTFDKAKHRDKHVASHIPCTAAHESWCVFWI